MLGVRRCFEKRRLLLSLYRLLKEQPASKYAASKIYMPLLYKRHTIVAGASRSETGDGYIPIAYISWEITPIERGTYAMISPSRYATFEEASAAAFADAKAWIDRHGEDLD